MRTIIIDDESKSRKTLQALLESFCPEVEVVAEAHSVASGLEAIRDHKPDLVFLDIEMPSGSGFELLEAIPHPNFQIVFCTAYDQYAIKAFKYSALDYLLKPIDPDELVRTINKARSQDAFKSNMVRLNVLVENLKQHEVQRKKLLLKGQKASEVVTLKDILYIEASVSYSQVHLAEGRIVVSSNNLKTYEDMLEEFQFFRIHKTWLVNLNHIQRYEKQDGTSVIMSNGEKLEVARRKKDQLLERLEKL